MLKNHARSHQEKVSFKSELTFDQKSLSNIHLMLKFFGCSDDSRD